MLCAKWEIVIGGHNVFERFTLNHAQRHTGKRSERGTQCFLQYASVYAHTLPFSQYLVSPFLEECTVPQDRHIASTYLNPICVMFDNGVFCRIGSTGCVVAAQNYKEQP